LEGFWRFWVETIVELGGGLEGGFEEPQYWERKEKREGVGERESGRGRTAVDVAQRRRGQDVGVHVGPLLVELVRRLRDGRRGARWGAERGMRRVPHAAHLA